MNEKKHTTVMNDKAVIGQSCNGLDTLSDELLIGRYATGEVAAFDCLYSRHKQVVLQFLRRQCVSHAIAEELVHDTWLAVIKQASNYQTTARFVTWLYRIAHNRLIDHWRKHGSSTNVLIDEVTDSLLSRQMDKQTGMHEDTAFDNLVINDLFASLQCLSAEQLAALLLKIEGFSYAEIADITQAGQETVKSRLRYAT